MSSLRNAVKRITHKERGQLQKRSHLGLLEKKHDYKKRADNYHRKEERLKSLRLRASMKNPDEYYFGMTHTQVIDGKHQKTDQAKQKEFDETIGHDTIRLMKDQDLNYIRIQRQKDTKQIQKLQSSLHFIDEQRQSTTTEVASRKRKHTIFVDSKEEVDHFDPSKHFDTAPDLVHRTFNRPRIEKLKKDAINIMGYNTGNDDDDDDDDNEQKLVLDEHEIEIHKVKMRLLSRKLAKARQRAYGEIEERKKRLEAMKTAEAHLATEKLLASSKGTRRKVQPAENGKPAVYKWRRRRLG